MIAEACSRRSSEEGGASFSELTNVTVAALLSAIAERGVGLPLELTRDLFAGLGEFGNVRFRVVGDVTTDAVDATGRVLNATTEGLRGAALDLDTSDPLTHYYIGAAYLYSGYSGYSGRNEIAVRFLERSLAGNPHQPDAMVHLGLAWGFLAEYERAYGYFDQADRMAALRTTSGPYGCYRGIVLGLEGRYEEAIPIVSQFLEGHPRYATARCALGIAHEMLGHPDKAKVANERACEFDPGLNVNGIALNLAAHPDREQGARREAILRHCWPAA